MPLRAARRHIALVAACMFVGALAACHFPGLNSMNAESKVEIKERPNPQQAYRIVMTIENAPGPFALVEGSARYDAINEQECGKLSTTPGAEGIASHVQTQPLVKMEKLSETSYATTVYADLMIDEDYFGRGVCQWAFSYMAALLRATGDERETRFLPSISAEEIAAGQAVVWYFWKGRYPRSQSDDFPSSGYTDPNEFKPDIRDELFTITLTPSRTTP
jgi:hypothetical protein